MAISNQKNSTTLQIKYEKGENKDGSPKIVSQKFSIISKAATDEEIYNIGSALAEVIDTESFSIRKVEDSSLISE